MLKTMTPEEKRDLKIWAYIFNTTPEELKAKTLDKNKKSIQSIEWTPEEKRQLKKEWGGIFKDLFEEKVKEDKPLETYKYNEPIYLILENRLGFQLSIETDLIEEYAIKPLKQPEEKNSNVYESNYFRLIMKFKDIEKLEYGAIDFLKKSQIFNVYMVDKDNKRDQISVPWKEDRSMVNSLQEVIIHEDEIWIVIRNLDKV